MMNKELLIKLLRLYAEHTKKLRDIDHIINHDYFDIDLFDVVMQEIGLRWELGGHREVFNETFVDECFSPADEFDFFNGNKPSFEAFFEVALNQAKLYQEEIKDQSRKARTRRLFDRHCPIHDVYMSQVDEWYDEHGQRYTCLECSFEECDVRAIEGQPLMLLREWKYLLD